MSVSITNLEYFCTITILFDTIFLFFKIVANYIKPIPFFFDLETLSLFWVVSFKLQVVSQKNFNFGVASFKLQVPKIRNIQLPTSNIQPKKICKTKKIK